MLVANGETKVIYPVVLVKVDGITCRALLDTGAGSSYASGALLDRLKKRPGRKEYKRIEMMMQSTSKLIEVHQVTISDLDEKFKLQAEVTKVDRSNLLCMENPRYNQIVHNYDHLKGVSMADVDGKPQLPVHLNLRCKRVRKDQNCNEAACVGRPGEPVAELTKFGWTLMSPGTEDHLTKTLFTKSSVEDYRKLCDMDVLGLDNQLEGDGAVYQDFKEQLTQSPERWYVTRLSWKPNTDRLRSNKAGSIARLGKLVQKLERKPELFQQYREIIKEQEEQGIIEVTQEPGGREFYLPHRSVVRESAESTKVRIVYDASAKVNDDSLSLNDCLETGPTLQNFCGTY